MEGGGLGRGVQGRGMGLEQERVSERGRGPMAGQKLRGTRAPWVAG